MTLGIRKKKPTYDSPWNPWTKRLALFGILAILVIAGSLFGFANVGEGDRASSSAPRSTQADPSPAPPSEPVTKARLQKETERVLSALVYDGSEVANATLVAVQAATGCDAFGGAEVVDTTHLDIAQALHDLDRMARNYRGQDGVDYVTRAELAMPDPEYAHYVVHLTLGWRCP